MEESDAEASEIDPLVTKDSCISVLDQRQKREADKAKKRADNKVSFNIKKNAALPAYRKPEKEPHHTTHRPPLSKPDDSRNPQPYSEGNEGPCMEEVHLPLRNKVTRTTDDSKAVICPFFGVKNYLHYFYERPDMKNALYLMDGSDEAFLVKQREGTCNSQIFRLSLIFGGIILLLGTIAFIIGMCTSRKVVLEGKVGGITVVGKIATDDNSEMDALLLVSLLAITIGATIVVAALISRTFCSQPEYDEAFRIGITSTCNHPVVIHHIDKGIPVTEQLTSIQPWAGPLYLSSKYPSCYE